MLIECTGPHDVIGYEAFDKHVLQAGRGESKPKKGAVCVCEIVFVEGFDLSEKEMGGYNCGEYHEVTIGEGDSFVSKHFDDILMTMTAGERAYIKSWLDSKTGMFSNRKPFFWDDNWCKYKFKVTLRSFQQAPGNEQRL